MLLAIEQFTTDCSDISVFDCFLNTFTVMMSQNFPLCVADCKLELLSYFVVIRQYN